MTELAPHAALGGLGVAVARLIEQLHAAGVGSRVLMPAGALPPGDRPQRWGELVSLPTTGTGIPRLIALNELALARRERDPDTPTTCIAHDHECAAAAVATRRQRPDDHVVTWLHSLYDTPHPSLLPESLREGLDPNSVTAGAIRCANLVVCSRGVLADAGDIEWPPRMQPMQRALLDAATRQAVLTVEADGCLPAMLGSDMPVPKRDRPRVVFAGRPGVPKGVPIFLEIAAALTDLDVEFQAFGDPIHAGIDPNAPGVQRIHWAKWQSPDDFWATLRSATCVLAPSLSEGFGLAPAEADALGITVLHHDIGGLRSLPTSHAHPIHLTTTERQALYTLWGNLIGSDTPTAWAAWATARPQLDDLIDRWIATVRTQLDAPSSTSHKRERSRPSSIGWGPSLLTALARH